MVTVVDEDAAEFREFFARHFAELARLAHVLTGETDAADDLAADAMVALWHRWDRVRDADHPVAYARGVVVHLVRSRIRGAVRERRRVALFWDRRSEHVDDPDVPAVVDVRSALRTLPFRKRACVVLRHAFDLSERDTAQVLAVSVGTVKSQTSKGVVELQRVLGPGAGSEPAARRAVPAGRHGVAGRDERTEGGHAARSATYAVAAGDASGRRTSAGGGLAPTAP
ncbi:SigE family RNA polymerase sigma factor [Streptomyces sp. NPDC047971]|uniref:SigE family RNA polymerase sigma factor n=1 Tax=Streptomyces sp. NPDC047971 TaxID=3154499 RepID=UPI0033F2A673